MSADENQDPAFEKLLYYLKQDRGFDFTEYKRASLIRRVNKRMKDVGIEGLGEYEDYLEVHPQEFTELFNTILINVTSFFRDQAAWDYLAEEIIPRILEAKTPNSTIRLWSAGCASGEEAYSLAILMSEAMGLEASRHQVKIYATDVDEEELELARQGAFTAKVIEGVPEKLRRKYFVSSNNNGSYIFRQDLRRTLVFGRHDLMHDAPISRLDLLLCRNTLIYFNREAQERIVARFHFALKDSGYLFLGRAETMLSYGTLFEPESMKHRTFRKISTAESNDRVKTLVQAGRDFNTGESDINLQIQEAAFEAMPVAGVVIDHHSNLAMANEEARARFGLDVRDLGRPFRDLELSYRPLELRAPIEQAREGRRSIVIQDVERTYPGEDGKEYLDVIVTPLWGNGNRWLGTAISFANATERQELRDELEQVRHDLETTYEELQSTNEELETSNEELQSTVEELQTTNEELQSSNEEMETMNEELQSSNSELQNINEELRDRTVDLNRAKAFMESILASVDLAVIAIDNEFRISLWNERAEDIWGLRAEEVVGQLLLDLDIGLPVNDLKEPIENFMGNRIENETLVLDATNRRGKAIKFHITRSVHQDAQGDVIGVVLLMKEEV